MTRATEPERGDRGLGRRRGTGFPRLSLDVVANLLTEAARSYGPAFSLEAFASLGTRRSDARGSTRSGTYLNKLAAFRDFGVVEVVGRQVRLTELAERIALASSPVDRREALRTAFLQVRLFRALYDGFPKGEVIPIETLADRAIWDHGVAGSARSAVIRSFVSSAETAGLLERAGEGSIRLLRPGPAEVERRTGANSVEAVRELEALPVVVQQRWQSQGHLVSFEIRARAPLRPSLFRQLADLMVEIEALSREIEGPAFDSEVRGPV